MIIVIMILRIGLLLLYFLKGKIQDIYLVAIMMRRRRRRRIQQQQQHLFLLEQLKLIPEDVNKMKNFIKLSLKFLGMVMNWIKKLRNLVVLILVLLLIIHQNQIRKIIIIIIIMLIFTHKGRLFEEHRD